MAQRFLRVYREQQHVEDLVLERPSYTIGRGRGAGILLDDESVGRSHALLTVAFDGCTLEDLGSENPTLVDGVPIREHPLQPGDRVTIGRYTLIYQEREGVPLTPPPESEGLHVAWSSDEATRMADAGELRTLGESVALPSLRCLDVPGQPRLSLQAERLVFGRGDDADVPARSFVPFVREMARLVREGDRCTLERLHGLVTVRVNGRRCTRQELEDQDEVRVGRSRFRIHVPARARAADYLG